MDPNYRPHDGRTNLVAIAKRYGVDGYAIEYMAGHKISDITQTVHTRRAFAQLRAESEKVE